MTQKEIDSVKIGDALILKGLNPDFVPSGKMRLIVSKENGRLVAKAPGDYQTYDVRAWSSGLEIEE